MTTYTQDIEKTIHAVKNTHDLGNLAHNIVNSPTTSKWLADNIIVAFQRDPVDMLNDTMYLLELVTRRATLEEEENIEMINRHAEKIGASL